VVSDEAELTALVRAAQRGDGLAMARLIDVLTPAIGRWCGPIALQDGPDATQEALIAVFRGLKGLAEPAALFGWARSIAVREAVRVARRATRQRTVELVDLPAPGDPLLAVDIADVLERLTPEHRAVLMLRELDGLDERTIAGLLDVPAGTVKSRLSRARRSFRKEWAR
jgi:DNA-directed RNA polymerase specialized sigma24 family protein